MERAFQTALLLQPDVVFILGDVFDEGKWSRSQVRGPHLLDELIKKQLGFHEGVDPQR